MVVRFRVRGEVDLPKRGSNRAPSSYTPQKINTFQDYNHIDTARG